MKAKAFLFSITRMAGPPAGLEESCSPHVRRGAREAFGWRKRLDRWYAPLKPRAKPITAARELYKAAPPAPGMDIPDLDPLAEATGTDEDEWDDEYGRYPEFRLAPDLGRGVWLMYPAIRRV